jgi:hypothetical protein
MLGTLRKPASNDISSTLLRITRPHLIKDQKKKISKDSEHQAMLTLQNNSSIIRIWNCLSPQVLISVCPRALASSIGRCHVRVKMISKILKMCSQNAEALK